MHGLKNSRLKNDPNLTIKAVKIKIKTEFNYDNMVLLLADYLKKHVPDLPKLVLPKLKKIELPKLKKED